ncbi:unnamed protein product [Anisakis simplex]|uniref:UBX domain-containing protein n=1 Tax=Anisakis simplex TaxID=6269 RepID=A0A0M3IZD4_ANISI|nr:unnamed protein product [Anisakis simplex]
MIIGWGSPRKNTTASKESSGYGSGSSESDPEFDQWISMLIVNLSAQKKDGYRFCVHLSDIDVDFVFQKQCDEFQLEKSRRRSVPAYLREAFPSEIFRVLETGGVLQFETDADTGLSTPTAATVLGHRSINRPESVLQLARKFAEASAVQVDSFIHAFTNSQQ